MKKIVALLLIIVAVLSLFGCSTKKFTKDGITLTLSRDFTEQPLAEVYGAHATYSSEKANVAVFKEALDDDVQFTLQEYVGEWLVFQNAFITEDVKEENEMVTVAYKVTYEGSTHIVYTAFYRQPKAIWIVQFFCPEENYEECSRDFVNWAKKVKFD